MMISYWYKPFDLLVYKYTNQRFKGLVCDVGWYVESENYYIQYAWYSKPRSSRPIRSLRYIVTCTVIRSQMPCSPLSAANHDYSRF